MRIWLSMMMIIQEWVEISWKSPSERKYTPYFFEKILSDRQHP